MDTNLKKDEHPLDKPLGYIHELAISLQMAGYTTDAKKLAEAHEQIQDWLIQNTRD